MVFRLNPSCSRVDLRIVVLKRVIAGRDGRDPRFLSAIYEAKDFCRAHGLLSFQWMEG